MEVCIRGLGKSWVRGWAWREGFLSVREEEMIVFLFWDGREVFFIFLDVVFLRSRNFKLLVEG